ncbi:TRAP transporter permease [Azospirillum halopraeferens]|uniref:TRAP transporter permease n=1 Tax=Azospirillum halopraeferens TaxID=34010 RepID=UPI0004127557|nr:TRAP transporter permease [Azospirillum halopraeferens]
MSDPRNEAASREDLQDLVARADTGARTPPGWSGKVLVGVALAWSLFQLWYASPLPFVFSVFILNDTEARAIHLAFAVFLAFTAFPAFKRSPRWTVPVIDWVLAAVAAFCAAYLWLFYAELSRRPGLPTTMDLVVGVTGMVLLLEATRRALGPPLTIVALVFLTYTFFGPWMPDVIAHRGASLTKGVTHYWLTTEGVYGVALGVSTSMVFLFVLFGALLERAGAGNYFIRVAFSLLGHMRGGPAKAAVVSSAMTGLISGSSIANVVTTGTFTIPLMKKVGFPAEKAGAVEVASSTNGQLTPPVMGAAAFLMVEFVGISYTEVIKHALLPALISYVALIYIVHLEALKAGMKGLPRRRATTVTQSLLSFLTVFLGLLVVTAVVYYGVGWMKDVFGDNAAPILSVAVLFAYLGLLWYATRYPELETTEDLTELPDPGPTVKAGLYFLLPVAVLVWSLTVERLSPGLSAFWAAVFMMAIVVTHRPLKALMRGRADAGHELTAGFRDLFDGLVTGARNMIGIGVATAAAGIVVGTVTLTGIGLVMTDFVEFISGGNLMLLLIFTAIISLILGMGLPTTANYIVVSTLMAPVIVNVGAEAGLIVPLIAVHLFVFYFGILADDTPPVGLAAFAAAAIAGGDPIRTGIQGFMYDIRTAILPFLFIFNTELLLIGVDSVWMAMFIFAAALIAMLAFAAATQGWFLIRTRWWEVVLLLLAAFTLFRPGFWMDMVIPQYETVPGAQVFEIAERVPERGRLRLNVTGETLEGRAVDRVAVLTLGSPGPGRQRLEQAGLFLAEEPDGTVVVDRIGFGSQAERAGIDFDFVVQGIVVEAQRPPKHIFYAPALVVLGIVIWSQRRRMRTQPAPEARYAARGGTP